MTVRTFALVESVPLPFKGFQFLRMSDPVFQDEAGHVPSAHFGVDRNGGQFTVFVRIEVRGDDVDFSFHLFPVKQIFHFRTGQIDQDATLFPDGADKDIGQQRTPMGK